MSKHQTTKNLRNNFGPSKAINFIPQRNWVLAKALYYITVQKPIKWFNTLLYNAEIVSDYFHDNKFESLYLRTKPDEACRQIYVEAQSNYLFHEKFNTSKPLH